MGRAPCNKILLIGLQLSLFSSFKVFPSQVKIDAFCGFLKLTPMQLRRELKPLKPPEASSMELSKINPPSPYALTALP